MDSAGTIVGCMRQTFGEIGFPIPEAKELRGTIGLSLDHAFSRLFPDSSTKDRARAIEVYRHHWLATYRYGSFLFDGSREVLEKLFERDYFLAVATGKGRPGLDRDLDTNDLRKFFLTTRTPHEAPSKPHPQMLLDIMDELGVEPRETLMIGDTTYDLDMARNAGTASVAVLTGTQDRAMLDASGPIACLPSVEALPDWLG